MSNTRKDRYETYSRKAIQAMQKSLFEDGLSELEAMGVLKVISVSLENILKDYANGEKTP